MPLFNPKQSDRYDGIVSVTFKFGKMIKIESNSITDQDWIPFIESLLKDISELYPDSGTLGINEIAGIYFTEDAIPLFLDTLNKSGIYNDRLAIDKCYNYDTVCNIVKLLDYLILLDNDTINIDKDKI